MNILFRIRSRASLAILLVSCLLVGCEAPRQTAKIAPSPGSASAAQTTEASPTAEPTTSMRAQAITLPVLDALFAGDSFESEAKSRAGLSDEQVKQLKELARRDVLDMTEDDTTPTHSTVAAVNKAEKEIRRILGDEKARKFTAFLQERLASESNDLEIAQSSQVPEDTRVVVNVPAYRMDIFKDGQLIKTYRIGIGYPEFPLATGLRKATTMIFNPTWTPPDEPWVKGEFKPGQKVEAGSKSNPLGFIKVPIGLPTLIHGGKSPTRLGKFASHGCVGLTDPLMRDFVVTLAGISGTALKESDIQGFSKDRDKTSEVKLAEPVPIELRYETIVVEDGKLKIFRDVYERGTNTEENLRRVLDSFGASLESLTEGDRQKVLRGLAQMARDSQGNPISGSSPDENKNEISPVVTRNTQGPTEFVFPIAALSKKGYPAPNKGKGWMR